MRIELSRYKGLFGSLRIHDGQRVLGVDSGRTKELPLE